MGICSQCEKYQKKWHAAFAALRLADYGMQ
jgi:hypothetical protein